MMLMAPWLVLLAAVVVAAVWALQRRDEDRDDAAVQVLDRRLAEGDLTVEEHAERRSALRQHGHGASSRPGGWGALATVLVAALVVIVLALLGMTSWGVGGRTGGHMGWGGSTTSSAEMIEGAREVEIEAGDLWFEPSTVEVEAGKPINVTLVNTGETFHDLTVPAVDLVLAAEPGEQASGAIEIAEQGRYEFSCTVPGHAQGGMRGTIIVTDAD